MLLRGAIIIFLPDIISERCFLPVREESFQLSSGFPSKEIRLLLLLLFKLPFFLSAAGHHSFFSIFPPALDEFGPLSIFVLSLPNPP
jgi:hypothetical protein